MKKYTLKNLTFDTLKKASVPLTATEIWFKAKEFGLQEKVESTGKTPWQSIGAYLYTNIKDNPDTTPFIQTSKRPARFTLKGIQQSIDHIPRVLNAPIPSKALFNERDLHPLLSTFVYSNQHFKCYTKTIYHERSAKEKSGKNKWLHPDIVGVYFPFDDYDHKTLKMIELFSENAIKLFSFEMKIEIDMLHLREYFFQAVSNSSWANEGYLVALKYSDDSEFYDEMRRLNNSFGIGFIRLDEKNVDQSEILLPAKVNSSLDWETINRLTEENPDFNEFIDSINKDHQVKEVRGKYDRVYETDSMQEYMKKHNITE